MSRYEQMTKAQLSTCFIECAFNARSGDATHPYAHFVQHLASKNHQLSIRLHTEPRRPLKAPQR